jgi:predicted permease
MRWVLVIVGVIVIFWLALLLGRWLPFGGPEDDAVRWGIATALASAVSAVAGLPLARWAEAKQGVSKET